MARLYVFDDNHSIVHFFFGMIIYALLPYSKLPALFGTVIFMFYEAPERESPIATLGDFEEFIMGALLGLALAWS